MQEFIHNLKGVPSGIENMTFGRGLEARQVIQSFCKGAKKIVETHKGEGASKQKATSIAKSIAKQYGFKQYAAISNKNNSNIQVYLS